MFSCRCIFDPKNNGSVMISRMVVYRKDVQVITGKSARSAGIVLANIRRILGKRPDQYITVSEFCSHTGVGRDEVEKRLTG
jgi:hypothetical protein